MSEIKKYKKYLNFKANPRYLSRDFIVPLYTGTEPDIYEDKKPNINDQEIIVDPSNILPKNFTDDMPFAPQQNVPGQQLELADGGSVERQGYSYAGLVTDYIKKKKTKTITSGELLDFLEKKKVKNPSKTLYKVLNNPSFIEQGFNVIKTGIREEKKYRPQPSFSKSELNKASQYFFNKDYNDLTDQAQRTKVYDKIRRAEGVFRKKTIFDQFSKTDQQKILKEFPDAVFKEGQSYGFKTTDPKFATVYNFVNRGFKMRNFKSLPKPVQNDIKANFSEVPEKDWNFKLYKYGLPETSGKNRNIGKRIQIFVTDPSTKEFRYNFGFGSPDGWMLAQMDRAYLNGDENYKPLYQNKKIIGFQDNTAKGGGKKYYHIKYKGPLDENKVLVNNHPDYKKVSKFVDVAKNAKTNIPEALAKLLPEGYDTNKLKFNDFLRFMLDDKKTDIKTLRNAIEIHHAKGLSSPTSDLQLLTRNANLLARDIEQQILKGDLSNVNKLKEEGIRLVVGGKSYGVGKETAEKGASRIQQQVVNHFKNNPEKLTEFINLMGCGPRINALGLGGRVKFSNGSSCYMKGLEKIESGELNQAERRIAGQFLKETGAGDELVKGMLSGSKNILKGFRELALGTGTIGTLIGTTLTVPFAAAESARGSPGGFGRELVSSLLENVNIIPGLDIDASKIAGTQVTQALERSARPGSQKMANYLFPIQEQSRKIDDLNKKLERFIYLRDNPSIESTPVSDQQVEMIQKQINEEKLTLQNLTNNLKKNITGEDLNDVKKDITALQAEAFKKAKNIADLRISNIADPEVKKYVQENPNRIILNAENIPTFINNLANEYGESARPLIDQITRNFENIKTLGEQGKEETGIFSPSGFIDVTEIYNDFLKQSEGYKTILDKQDLETKPLTEDQRINIEEMGARGGAARGGRIGFKDGTDEKPIIPIDPLSDDTKSKNIMDTKLTRRQVIGGIGIAAGAPIIAKLMQEGKATKILQAGKLASKIKIEPTEGMYPWFPKLVEKIKKMGEPFEEKQLIMEPSYKNDPRPFISGIPKGQEKVTKHVDGDTTFILREYPDGRIAVDIDSPRNQQSYGQPVSLYYRPKMEFKNYKGETKIEPPEFKVLEPEPRPFVNGPDDVDITFTEIPKNPSRNIVYGDIEAAERFATGKIKNRKIIPVKQSLRNEMEEEPSTFIMRQSGELGSEARPEQIIKIPEEKATGGRVGFSSGGPPAIKIARLISEALRELKNSTSMVSNTARYQGVKNAKLEALTPYKNVPDENKHINILNKIEKTRENLPKEYHSILDDIKKDVDNFDYIKADDRIMALDEAVSPELKFENLSKDIFPMEDPLNDAFIIIDPEKNHSVGRYIQRYSIDPETRRGIVQTFDTWDSKNQRFYPKGEEQLRGVESIEKGKEGLN